MMRRLPDWPRMMKRTTVCAYLDVSAAELEREIAAGRLPLPVKVGNADHWSRAAIDASIEKLAGESAFDDWRKGQPLYGSAA